jgi:hypothetical protein
MGLVQSIVRWWNAPKTVDDLAGSKRSYTMEEEEIMEAKLALVQGT